jgi:hypothetical protein
VLATGERFGAAAQGERIHVEFVSANPTGPLTAASGRHAAFGDALARILELAGNTIEREYYFNDGGGQVLRLGRSIAAAGARRGAARGRLPGRVRGRAGRPDPGRAFQVARGARERGRRAPDGRDPGDARALPRAVRPLVLRGVPLRGRAERLGAGARAARGRGALLPQRGRALAAHDGARRRQGPRARALDGRADLPGVGRRLLARQARARLRPPDQRARRRPPRLRRAPQGHRRGRGRRPRTGSRSRSSSSCTSSKAARARRCPSGAATS